MRIGLISDTHGYLDPKVHALFAGVETILHAGDIGPASIILELEGIAPTVAVLGNNDSMLEFREVEKAELGGKSFLIHHIVNPRLPSERVERLLKHSRADFVIFGHSHKVFDETIDGTRFINPGYSGKPRLGLARTVGVLELSNPAHPRFTVHPL